MDLKAGSDFRLTQYRQEVFQRFYTFHLRYRSHPGAVYYVLPYLARELNWDVEQRAWAAFINGNTQNPVTTLLLMQQGSRPEQAGRVLKFWRQHYRDLEWDTDRRYHKSKFAEAVASYLNLTRAGQDAYWRHAAAGDWTGVWRAANEIYTMGRLSAWSYLEYVRLLGVGARGRHWLPDADTLLLRDKDGSKSHRNGLALVHGLDEWIWWDRNPNFRGDYPPEVLGELERLGEHLLSIAKVRNPDNPDVGYLTLESALCTYKSWHRPKRRYPNVYNDLLYNRLVRAEAKFGTRFEAIWDARAAELPPRLRLECNPLDPGVVPDKQNHYLNTGQVIVMDGDWPCFENDFSARVAAGAFGTRKDDRCPLLTSPLSSYATGGGTNEKIIIAQTSVSTAPN